MDALLYMLSFALIAALLYFVDKRFGAPVYRRGYNLWHKEPLSDGIERGFIVGRKAKARILPSFVLTITSCFLLSYYIHDPIELVMKSPLVFIGLFLGFLLTGFAMREGKKSNSVVDKVCDVMDGLEEGKLDLSGAAGGAIKRGVEQTKVALSKVADGAVEKVAELRSVKTAATEPVAPVDAVDAPEDSSPDVKVATKTSLADAMNEFQRRR